MGSLIQIVFDVFAALGFFIIIMRLNRAPKDDPRLSRGLQLLQSKIAVLEDLSDRTEEQVNQMAALLDQKGREVQAKIQLAEKHVQEIRVSMQNSLEVAKIFQDKIPHQEIIERQNSIKYLQAARLAHQGLSAEQIAEKVVLPKGEIEFIAKVNRDRLMFNEDHLPAWAKGSELSSSVSSQGVAQSPQQETPQYLTQNFSSNPNSPTDQRVDQMNDQAVNLTADQTTDRPLRQALGYSFDQSSEETAERAFQSVEASQMVPGAASFTAPGPLAHLSFDDQQLETAARLRAEMQIAERQRLIENLSRLQFEMQNLDMQLAREHGGRDLSQAFEIPRTHSESLQKIGDEFKRACDEAGKLAEAPVKLTSDVSQPVESTSTFSTSAAYRASMIAKKDDQPRDPVLARALAQAKVQSALRRGSIGGSNSLQPKAQEDNASNIVSAELVAARAIAKESAMRVGGNPTMQSPVINGRPSSQAPVIRKVQFPKIDNPDN